MRHSVGSAPGAWHPLETIVCDIAFRASAALSKASGLAIGRGLAATALLSNKPNEIALRLWIRVQRTRRALIKALRSAQSSVAGAVGCRHCHSFETRTLIAASGSHRIYRVYESCFTQLGARARLGMRGRRPGTTRADKWRARARAAARQLRATPASPQRCQLVTRCYALPRAAPIRAPNQTRSTSLS